MSTPIASKYRFNIIVKSMCEDLGYNDDLDVIDLASNEFIYQGKISIYPNPFKLTPDKTILGGSKTIPYYQAGYGIIKDGSYSGYCNNSPKHGKCFYVKDPVLCKGSFTYTVQCRNRIPNMVNCEIHSGGIDSVNKLWRGSKGCMTIHPDSWSDFISLFNFGDKVDIDITTIQEIKDREPSFFNKTR